MSQHPSLKENKEEGRFRSVLKRYEKIKELAEKEKWDEEKDSVYHLPKVKRIKFKVKKVKGPEEEEAAAEAQGQAATTEEGAAGAESKGAKEPVKGGKEPAKKEEKKK